MTDLKINGYATTQTPVEDGDVALVIRKDGTVEAIVPTCLTPDREGMESLNPNIITVYGLISLLASSPQLIELARQEADNNIREAMSLRVQN